MPPLSGRVLLLGAVAAALGCGENSASGPGGKDGTDGAGPPALLTDVSDRMGVRAVHVMELSGEFLIPETMGSGVAVFDANGDERPDVLLANAGAGPGAGAPNVLLLQTADGRFAEAPGASGLAGDGFTHGFAVADVDNDGDLDVYEGNWGADRLYRNDGDGRFADVTAEAGIVDNALTSSVAFLDYDLDGHLDVYVAHYVVVDPSQKCTGLDGHRDYCGPTAYEPESDALYRNRGDGTFVDVSAAANITTLAGAGLGVAVADFSGDAWPDVYVANDASPNHLWINQRDGTFREDAVLSGAAVSAQGTPESSMGLAVGDVNGDSYLDVFVTHLDTETNTLYLGGARGGFRDATVSAGLAGPSMPFTGFGTCFADLDHDGDLDILSVNGRVSRRAQLAGDAVWEAYAEHNQLFLNDGKGSFSDASDAAGSYANELEVSRGLAASDLDGDGDLDFVVTNARGRARVYENTAPKRGHWLRVAVRDAELRRDVFGAAVLVTTGARTQRRVIGPASSYLSSSQIDAHFGLGEVTTVDALVVVWPGGERETFEVAGVDREIEVVRGGGRR